ncbi:MAG: hypothetical protein IJC43_08775 [Clostridia bacterium]|nr:hypothetical protein [Clostridia bacterium]
MKERVVTGSLIERSGKYTAMLNLYDENGKRKQKSVILDIPVKGNKRKAQLALEKLKREYGGASQVLCEAKHESPLFADFLLDWLRIVSPTIEPITADGYRSMLDARLLPFFRERELHLGEVEPRHIRALHESIFRDGCSANTVIHYHAVLREPCNMHNNEPISGNHCRNRLLLCGFWKMMQVEGASTVVEETECVGKRPACSTD